MTEQVSERRVEVGEAPVFRSLASLAEALEGPRSRYFGVTPERRPRDAETYYRAGGVSGAEEPPAFHLSFEITNHRLLCAITSTGLLRDPVIASRAVPAHRRGREFLGEQLLGGSPWGFALQRADRAPVSLPLTHGVSVELLGGLFPLFTYQCEGLQVRVLAFTPEREGTDPARPRAVIAVVEVSNPGAEAVEAGVIVPGLHEGAALAAPVSSPHPRFTEHPVPVQPGVETVIGLEETAWQPAFPEVRVTLAPQARRVLAFAFLLGDSPEDVRQTTEEVRGQTALAWLNQTWEAALPRYGRLSIPGDPYYAESFVRLGEEARNAVLYATEGSYWGGGPSGFGDYGLTLTEPTLVADACSRSLAGYQPRVASDPEPEAEIDSLVNSLGPLPQAGLYYRATGDATFFRRHPELLVFAAETLGKLLDVRRDGPFLFRSKMLWDGPTRGDYHTGSNLLAWFSFASMARLAREVYDASELADRWQAAAAQMREDIGRHCAGEGSAGPRFFEGVNADGTFVLGHDGEEAFTTLMPFFGFCEADDPRYVNHARLALSPENPIHAPGVDGLWWVDGRGGKWSGWGEHPTAGAVATTMPGQMAMLAGVRNEQELYARLEQLRRVTDLDGSIWWWPYSAPAMDPRDVRRRDVGGCDLSKSSYVAALYLCLFVHNVLGLSADVPAQCVALRPFSPWPEFRWERARLGRAVFDVTYARRENRAMGEIINRNAVAYDALIELTLPEGAEPATVPEGAARTQRYGRAAVRLSRRIAPEEALRLEVPCIGGERRAR